MSYDYDDYEPYEPSEADEILNEFAEKMKQSLKSEVKGRIEAALAENETLKQRVSVLEGKLNKTKSELYTLKKREETIEGKIRGEKAAEFLKDLQLVLYEKVSTYPKLPKCDKCGDDRKIRFTSPQGREYSEDCRSCGTGKCVYIPKEKKVYQFKQDRRFKQDSLTLYFKLADDDFYREKIHIDVAEENWEPAPSWKMCFTTEEACQKYCDYLNKKNAA